jgi:hypothetical protein
LKNIKSIIIPIYHQRTRHSNGCCSGQNSAKGNDADNMIALDGEREISVYKRENFTIRLNLQGPWVIEVAGVLSFASINKHFITVDRFVKSQNFDFCSL